VTETMDTPRDMSRHAAGCTAWRCAWEWRSANGGGNCNSTPDAEIHHSGTVDSHVFRPKACSCGVTFQLTSEVTTDPWAKVKDRMAGAVATTKMVYRKEDVDAALTLERQQHATQLASHRTTELELNALIARLQADLAEARQR